jgi:hypothetical protein
MNESNLRDDEKLATRAISLDQAMSLLQEMSRRLTVVSEQGLGHLLARGVIAPVARDGCCKPDGGTCCPNKKVTVGPVEFNSRF